MHEVAIYEAADVNAFATGMNRDRALIAVSGGLLDSLKRNEAEAVLGHEITHVANGDIVTLALIQGVLNTFVFFLARIIGNLVDKTIFRSENNRPGPAFWITTIIAEIVLGLLATIIVLWFSRYREFRADAGGANLTSRSNMISALERLAHPREPPAMPNALRAFGIAGGGGWMRLFMTHPPIEERIAALRVA